jgi:[ribosomal protein S5]-alanine N-acetyltransferase
MAVKAKVKEKYDVKKDAESLGKMIRSFGETISEIFEDPELRKKAKEFSQSVIDSAAKVVESKIRNDEAKRKFRDAGRAAQSLGKTLVEHFDTEKR